MYNKFEQIEEMQSECNTHSLVRNFVLYSLVDVIIAYTLKWCREIVGIKTLVTYDITLYFTIETTDLLFFFSFMIIQLLLIFYLQLDMVYTMVHMHDRMSYMHLH